MFQVLIDSGDARGETTVGFTDKPTSFRSMDRSAIVRNGVVEEIRGDADQLTVEDTEQLIRVHAALDVLIMSRGRVRDDQHLERKGGIRIAEGCLSDGK